MSADLVSALRTALLGVVVIGGVGVVALIGLLLVRRSVELETLEAHAEVAGFVYAIVGVVYAVLLGLVVAAVWTQFENARGVAEREANAVAGLYRLARAVPVAEQARMQAGVRAYARVVIDEEWLLMQDGRSSDHAWAALDDLWAGFLGLVPVSPGDAAVYQAAIGHMQDLGQARRSRLLLSRASVPPIMWIGLFGGAVSTIGFTYFFGVRKFAAQALMTLTLAFTIGLALFVIFVMDHPFTGGGSIPPEALQQVIEMFDRLGP